ncbi:type-1 domain-containing 4-like isoform X1 [Octopus vulgaris]|uniref:Type-1 domain-containing 4-like isoform X1 n=1 Tax=Octopus vulgaris TaxID=6645 RepID=A0AA36FA37_OCTVU|nr:type-1 domain-containing 4-like isoform X1 [Octopus vulgaris]
MNIKTLSHKSKHLINNSGFLLLFFYCSDPISASNRTEEEVTDELEGSTSEVEGAWTMWSKWTKCSQLCNGGLANRTRACIHRYVGEASETANAKCKGRKTETKVCNQNECHGGSVRQKLCRPYMHRKFYGKRYYWQAHIDSRRVCQAVCYARRPNFYIPVGKTVPDGTPCDKSGRDVCIAGKCHKVGCDGLLDSTAKEDSCGVCNGNNMACRVVHANITGDQTFMKYGYNPLMIIPKGAFNIYIKELKPSRNYLAIKTKSGHGLLNTHWRLSPYGIKRIPGTVLDYQRQKNTSCPGQCIFIVGPLSEDIQIQLLFYRESSEISYQFSAQLDMNGGHSEKKNSHTEKHSSWKHGSSSRHHHSSNSRKPISSHSVETGSNGHHHNEDKKMRTKNGRYHYDESFMSPHHRRHRKGPRDPTTVSPPHPTTVRSRKYHGTFVRKNITENRGFRNQNNRGVLRPSINGGDYQKHHVSRPSVYRNSHGENGAVNRKPWNNPFVSRRQPVHRKSSISLSGPRKPPLTFENTDTNQDKIVRRKQPVKVNGDYHGRKLGTSELELASSKSVDNSRPVSRFFVENTGVNNKTSTSIDDSTSGYSWRISGFTECTQPCGGGIEETIIVCVKDNTQVLVTDENCNENDKPITKTVSCNTQPCRAEWAAGPWSACSASCGTGTQTRQILCQQRMSATFNQTVSAEQCRGKTKPGKTKRECSLQPCHFWQVGNWTACSSSCGKGIHQRDVSCMSINGSNADDADCEENKPLSEELCDMGSCAVGWFYTHWPKTCPVECGEGSVRRKLHCSADDNSALPDERCQNFTKPRTEKKCKSDIPCGGKWFLGPWSKCNVTCGTGFEIRSVICIKELSGYIHMVVKDNNCALDEKPNATKPCELEPCGPQWYMMNWSECSRTCDLGHRTREVKCLTEDNKASLDCDVKKKPNKRESCNIQECSMSTTKAARI